MTESDVEVLVDSVLTAVRKDIDGKSTRWSVAGTPGRYALTISWRMQGTDWVTTKSVTSQTLTSAVEHDPTLTRLQAGTGTEFVIDGRLALALASKLTSAANEAGADGETSSDEEPIGTVNEYTIRFLPRPDTSELVAVLVSDDLDEPLGRQIGLYRWTDDYFPSTTGTKWLIEFAPGLAVAGGDGDFYQDLAIKLVGASGPDGWEWDLAMDGEEWDLAVENGDAEFVVHGPGLGPLSLDSPGAGAPGTARTCKEI